MPRNAAGEVPLRTLTDLLKDSAREVRASGEEGSMELQVMRLNNALALQAERDDTLRADLQYIQETIDEAREDIEDVADDIARVFSVREPRKVADFTDQLEAVKDSLIVEKIEDAHRGYIVANRARTDSVSYTHLTLPTIYSV